MRFWRWVTGSVTIEVGWNADGVNKRSHRQFRSESGAYTVTAADFTVYLPSGSSGQQTLLKATSALLGIEFEWINARATDADVNPTGSDVLTDGGAITAGATVRYKLVLFDGTNGTWRRNT